MINGECISVSKENMLRYGWINIHVLNEMNIHIMCSMWFRDLLVVKAGVAY